jgi:hypothetical protein
LSSAILIASMADDLLKMKYDKLLSELKFVEDDLKYHKVFVDSGMREFTEKFNKKMKDMGFVSSPRPPKKEQDEASKKLTQPKKTPQKKETRELFKKIATVTHPDKLLGLSLDEREAREKKFLEASEAASEDKILSLHKIACEVGVELPEISPIQLALFEEQIASHREEVEGMKKTWMWVWINSPDEASKDLIMQKYIDFLLTNPKL